MLKEVIVNFIGVNYISLILILVLTIFIFVNKEEKPKEIQCFVLIIGLVFIMLFLNFFEKYADSLLKSESMHYSPAEVKKLVRFIYFKAFMEYCIYSGILLLEIVLMTSHRGKRLLFLCIPELLLVIMSGISMCGVPLVYQYDEYGSWVGNTPFHFLPYAVSFIYLFVLTIHSLGLLGKKDGREMGGILLMVVIVTMVTGFLENKGILTGYMDEVVLVDILVYYYYFYSVYRKRIKEELYEKELEMERDKTTLLMAQIKPHFIYNCLAIIRYLCGVDSKMAEETIEHFSDYLRQSMEIITKIDCIPFSDEMKLVDNYLYMEKKRFGEKIRIEKKIEAYKFKIPPLTLQPLVENAVKHGLQGRGRNKAGLVTISAWEENDAYLVMVEDNGVGVDQELLEQKDAQRVHIGIDNVKLRLELMASGTLTIESEPVTGTKAIMRLPKK